MPVATAALDSLARAYVATMTSIRGRRVHRLLMREFARFDLVLPASAEDGSPALLALSDEGRAAICATDGRGAAATIAECPSLDGATVTLAYDLLRDSLPVVAWTVRHPTFGSLTIAAEAVAAADHARVTAALPGR